MKHGLPQFSFCERDPRVSAKRFVRSQITVFVPIGVLSFYGIYTVFVRYLYGICVEYEILEITSLWRRGLFLYHTRQRFF